MTIIATGAADLPAQAHRQQTSLLLSPSSTDPIAVLAGVHAGLALTKTTGMGFSIGPGRAAVNAATSTDGTFTVTVTASETGSFAPGDATRNRIDLITLQTYPDQPATAGAAVVVVTGAYPVSGLPVAPAVPSGALGLFQVPVNAGVSSGNGGWDPSKVVDIRPALMLANEKPQISAPLALQGIYKAMGGNYGVPTCTTDSKGRTWLSGAISSSVLPVTHTAAQKYTIATLPVGQRPVNDKLFPVAIDVATGGLGLLYVMANGALQYCTYATATSSTWFLTLDGVTW